MTEETKGTPADFVYAGRRMGTKGVMHAICVVLPGGDLAGIRVYDKKAFKHQPTVGAIYRGASFDEKTAWGLLGATWAGRWEDRVTVAGWEALDAEVAAKLATKRMEEKAKGEIETLMLPIRQIAHKLRKRGAHAEAQALCNLVTQEMYRPLTAAEREELECLR